MKHNTIVIYHRADADGKLSNAIARKALTAQHHEVTSIGWDYGDPIPQIPKEADSVYMLDISIPEILNSVDLREKIVWIDHHKTAIAAHPNHYGYQVDGVAACRLCWQWFENRHLPMPEPSAYRQAERSKLKEPLSVLLVGIRDTWSHIGDPLQKEAEALNHGLLGDPDFNWTLSLVDDTPTQRAIAAGHFCGNYAAALAREHCERGARIVMWKGLRFLTLNTLGRGSMVLDAWAKDLPPKSSEALMVYAVDRLGRVVVSLYHHPENKGLDLSTLAKEMGGGGHKGACGFITDIGFIKKLHEE